MVIVAAGDIKHDNFVREVEKQLGGFRSKADSTIPQYAQYVGGDFREAVRQAKGNAEAAIRSGDRPGP